MPQLFGHQKSNLTSEEFIAAPQAQLISVSGTHDSEVITLQTKQIDGTWKTADAEAVFTNGLNTNSESQVLVHMPSGTVYRVELTSAGGSTDVHCTMSD